MRILPSVGNACRTVRDAQLSLRRHTSFRSSAVALTIALILAGCGGGGGGAPTAVKSVTVSGRATYTDYDVSRNGIGYSTPSERPIRGAVVEVQSPPGTTLLTGNTSDNGEYAFAGVPENASVRVVVKAALGDTTTPNTKVIDNTNADKLYEVDSLAATGTSNLTLNFNAASGWDGTRYSNPRAAGPFAILDVIYQAQQMVKAVDAAVVFPPLDVHWSINNKPASNFAPSVGDIPGSFYVSRSTAKRFNIKEGMYILGAADVDTDEYDSHIIAHEWAHYFEAKFSRSDSPNGSHEITVDLLDPSLAFGEGYGYAMAGMILNDPVVVNTSGPGQRSGADINLDLDVIPNNRLWRDPATGTTYPNVTLDGSYSEVSIHEILFDLFDSGPGDDDPVGLGFGPIYRVLTGGHKNTPAFTSIFSFLHHLKLEVPSQSAAIDALARAENIGLTGYNEFESVQANGMPDLYTDVFPGVAPFTVNTLDIFGPINANNATGNKFLNRAHVRFNAPIAGCYLLTFTPVTPTAADLVVFLQDGEFRDDKRSGMAETIYRAYGDLGVGVFSVGSDLPNLTATVGGARVGDSSDPACA